MTLPLVLQIQVLLAAGISGGPRGGARPCPGSAKSLTGSVLCCRS